MRIALHAEGRTLRGNEQQLLVLVQGLVQRGHEVHVSCFTQSPVGQAFAAAGAHITGARPRGDLDPFSLLQFAAWLRRVRPDALLLTSWRPLLTAAAGARLAGVPRVVFRLGGMHGFGNAVRAALARRAFERWIDAVYVNSTEVAERLRAQVPRLGAERIVRVRNAVVLPAVEPFPLRASLGLPADALVLLGVGVLTPLKGFDSAIRALHALGDERVHLAIAGSGAEHGALRALAASLGMGARVHLLGQRTDVPALLRAADAYVLASHTEGMSVSLMEAMAAGLPVIATDVGGVQELLAPREGRGAAGWIVPAGDAAALAAALREWRRDPDEALCRSREAARRIDEEFTVERLLDGVERLLRGERGVPGAR